MVQCVVGWVKKKSFTIARDIRWTVRAFLIFGSRLISETCSNEMQYLSRIPDSVNYIVSARRLL